MNWRLGRKQKVDRQPPQVVNYFNYYGNVEKIIHETRHDSAGDTSLQSVPPAKGKLPILQYLYWILGILVAAFAIYEKWGKK